MIIAAFLKNYKQKKSALVNLKCIGRYKYGAVLKAQMFLHFEELFLCKIIGGESFEVLKLH
jgi:hypothetical protein